MAICGHCVQCAAYYGLVCWCGVYGHGGHVAMLAMVIVSHPATGLSAVLANQPSHPVHSPAEPASLMAIHSTATAGLLAGGALCFC